ncbi:MAG: uridine diphosphate-N-acetylglucosamine-binding protein YvcK [Candidatus Omnitrophota bacterium]
MKNDILIVAGKDFIENISEFLFQQNYGINIADSEAEILRKSQQESVKAIVFDGDICRGRACKALTKAIKKTGKKFITVSSKRTFKAIIEARDSGSADYIIKPYNYREFLLRLNALVYNKRKVSCIGGGTGLFNILMSIKTLPDVLLTSIVSTSDDGGSSGRLRLDFDILPPGDIRRSLVALSNAPEIMNNIMQYRFHKGRDLAGHSFGNLFLTALSDIKGSMSEAIVGLSDILNIQGIVLPVTTDKTTLCAEFEEGTVIKGESKIDQAEGRSPGLHIKKLWHEPTPKCHINAFSSIAYADTIIIGPGDLFTSIVTNLAIADLQKAIVSSKAQKIYICNLMSKPGETTGYTAKDHIAEVVKYMKGDYLDTIVVSNTPLSQRTLDIYKKKSQYPVKTGDMEKIKSLTKAEMIIADVGHQEELVRHDSQKIRKVLSSMIKNI